MYYNHLTGALEALLFASGDALSVAKIAELMHIEKPQVWELITGLSKEYEAENRGLTIREVNGGYQLVTKPIYIEMLSQLKITREIKLTNAAMETLATIAFKQPVTKAEIEAIRGVKADSALNTLQELDLITEAGRKKALGNPILYATTEKFLTVFGLDSLESLTMPKLLNTV
ncbi:MAG: SMC-Scp complex subunit ScpB [Phascolarctobacterium sp.]|nr:SMC-Scp complex subunit ScpB [Phascolarctobacterium sp.]MCD8174457.1 SMC-Scp complex subunit ScpB [Phascolarctobacterium sp.]